MAKKVKKAKKVKSAIRRGVKTAKKSVAKALKKRHPGVRPPPR
ncbi:ribosomal protein S5 [Bradyrhizobium sp. AZCC 1610]